MTSVSARMAPIEPLPRRWQGLPEHANYRDTGCEVSPSCLRCPLPVCKYDLGMVRGPKPTTLMRAARIRQHQQLGRSLRQIAVLEDVSLRTVTATLRAAREVGMSICHG